MPVTDVRKDGERLMLVLTAEFASPVADVWQIWADPRMLERWWGPPTYPATVVEHDLTVGGRVAYYMTGPTGDRHHGWWEITSVDAPTSLSFVDGFADESGELNPEMPTTTARVSIMATDDGARMTIETRFGSLEQMEQLVAMQMIEGITAAVNQIDALLGA
jgi:uncharacterized protein YndB with AHSA1/START domain